MANRYWVGNGGDWFDTAHWSANDGGLGGESVPSGEDVFLTANSFTIPGQTITSVAGLQNSLDCTGVLNSPTLTGTDLYVKTKLKLTSSMYVTMSTLGIRYPAARQIVTVEIPGPNKKFNFVADDTSGYDDYDIDLASDFELIAAPAKGGILLSNTGYFNTNGYNITGNYFYSAKSQELHFNSSNITLYRVGTSPVIYIVSATVIPGTSTITVSGSGTVPLIGMVDFYNLKIKNVNLNIQTPISAEDIEILSETASGSMLIKADNIAANSISTGERGVHNLTLAPYTALTEWELSLGTVSQVDKVIISYCNATNKTLYAADSSVDGGSNINVIFDTMPPPTAGFNIYLGTDWVTNIYKGTTEIIEAYLGTDTLK